MPTTTSDRITNPTADDITCFLRKHRDFRGISDRGLCVLVYRNGAYSVPVCGLTAEERAEVMRGRCGRFSAEERADAAKHGVRLPAAKAKSAETLF